jgi:hypothetical protein
MKQLEIEFFWPLTEQIPLDLDYTQPEKPSLYGSGQLLSINGISGASWSTINTTPTVQFRPEPDAVGYWQIDKNLQCWRKNKPLWLHRKMTKLFFGWEWKDK